MHPNASLDAIVAFLDRLLEVDRFAAEEGANGLVYRAGEGVSKFAAAVNTSLATIVGAAKSGAQLLVVHHTTWPGIDLHLRDEKLKLLEQAGISLYAAHASLDCARDFGNSWVLARLLGVRVEDTFAEFYGGHAGVIGGCDGTFTELIQRSSAALGVQVEAHAHAKAFGRVAVVTGGGGETAMLDDARQRGADTYITGEGSMYTRMFALESQMNLILGTHHATEAPGIRALAERIAAEAQIEWEFVPDSPGVF
jgi:dinuclear metal center YbgI/SA1388 family protein